jgi:hypothetical protein
VTVALTRSGNNLQIGGATRKLSGANAYWVGLDDNAGTGSGSFPSHATITSAFQGMRAMGTNLVRAHTVGISAGTSLSYETAPGVYSDANLDSADWAVYQAGLQGIYLMVPLTDMWNYYHGGKGVFVHWAAQQGGSGAPTDVPAPTHLFDADGSEKGASAEDQFFTNANVRVLFKDYISHWLNHVNPYTGLAYKNDPTIAIIETGNELYKAAQQASNEWTQDIASYVKSIAPAKLVADGSAADRVAVSSQPGLTASAVDIVGAHYYPQQQSGTYPPVEFNNSAAGYPAGTALQQLAADAQAAVTAGKAFIVGEYPWTRSTVGSWYTALENTPGISGDMYWSFIAGTETHGGAFGSDDYPVHYPYLSGNEATYAPALATHTRNESGVGMATVRVVKVSGSLANSGHLRVARLSGTVAVGNSKVRIVKLGGTVGVKNIVRVTRVSGSITQSASMNDIATQTVRSFDTVTITPTTASGGTAPTGYRYTLIPNTDVRSVPVTQTGNSLKFTAPGRFNGCTVQFKVEALNGATVIGTKTATVTVGPHSTYVYQNGAWVAIKEPIRLTRA